MSLVLLALEFDSNQYLAKEKLCGSFVAMTRNSLRSMERPVYYREEVPDVYEYSLDMLEEKGWNPGHTELKAKFFYREVLGLAAGQQEYYSLVSKLASIASWLHWYVSRRGPVTLALILQPPLIFLQVR